MKLSKTDTAFLKGIAILLIVAHNFCHWLPRCIAENEYSFDASRVARYVDYLVSGGPHVVLNFISHYGHYGVPLFLFLSGYGLVKKYESPKAIASTGPGPLQFIWQHATKLWWLMLPAIAIYWFCEQTFGGHWTPEPGDLLAMITYTANLFIVRDLFLGPWWFFSLILQLYVVYRLVLYRRSTWLVGLVVVGCLALQAWLYYCEVRLTPDFKLHIHDPRLSHWSLFNYCRYNFPGSILPFGLGIAAARHEFIMPRRALWASVVIGTALLLISATNALLWQLSPIFLIMALVPLARLVGCAVMRRPLEWLGGISASIFALHPIVRAYLIPLAKDFELVGDWWLTYVVIAIYLIVSIAAAWVMNAGINKLKRLC